MSLTTNSEADILSRVIGPDKPGLSAEVARAILSLSFDADDVDRMNVLSRRAGEGTLTADEHEELNCYERMGHLLAILQLKARTSLKNSPSETSHV